MGIVIGDNFNYQGRKMLDDRAAFETLEKMRNYPETSLRNGIITWNDETNKHYYFLNENTCDITLGKWRELKTGSSSSGSGNTNEGASVQSNFHIGPEPPTDTSLIWIDTTDNVVNDKFESEVIDELRATLVAMQGMIDDLREEINDLKAGGTIVSDIAGAMLCENDDYLMTEDGLYLVFE